MGYNDPIVKGESFWDDAINLFCLRPVWRNRSNIELAPSANEKNSKPRQNKGEDEVRSQNHEESKIRIERLWERASEDLKLIARVQDKTIMQEISALESLAERTFDISTRQLLSDLKSHIKGSHTKSLKMQNEIVEFFIEEIFSILEPELYDSRHENPDTGHSAYEASETKPKNNN